MAEKSEEILDALDDAIIALGAKAGAETAGYRAESFAAATRSLAEARAWIINPAQPHGGSTSVTVTGK